MTVRGKSIWIHDVSQELPAVLALELARAGNYVLVSGSDEVALQRLIDRGRGAIDGFKLDLTSPDSRGEAADRLTLMTDRLDIAICQSLPKISIGVPLWPHTLQGDVMATVTEGLFTNVVHFVELATPLQRQIARPQLLIINPMNSATPFRSGAYRAPDAALEAFVRALSADPDYRNFCVNLALVRSTTASSRDSAATTLPLASQLIAAMGQTKIPICIPRRGGYLRNLLAWRPKGWYRPGHGMATSAKGGYQ